MNRNAFEKYLNQKVKVKLFDGDILEGYLHKTGDEKFKNNFNLYYSQNYYFLTPDEHSIQAVKNIMFRVTHVVRIEVIE